MLYELMSMLDAKSDIFYSWPVLLVVGLLFINQKTTTSVKVTVTVIISKII